MSDKESIEYDVLMDIKYKIEAFDQASSESALEQCIYLFVEGESEEIAFRILLEEGLGINFEKEGVVIANYNGIGNLKHTIRLMQKTLSHSRPMIFTFDDDDKKLISKIGALPSNFHLFKIPFEPVVKLPNGDFGGSFEESFEPSDFIEACFNTAFLRSKPQISKQDFMGVFDSKKPFYAQMVKFLKTKGLSNYALPKPEIAENMAVSCELEPDTYIKLSELIKVVRASNPIQVKI
jgi:hypothetical protein